MSFNLSKWALENRSLVVYMMIAATIAGLASFYRLGRDEDPPFVIKTMVVQAAWPGATLNDTLQQLTDRLERTLQETPSLDFLRSYTSPGLTTIFVNLKGETRAAQIPAIWYDVRTSIGDMRHTLPDGVIGPGFNDKFGDVFGIIYGITADGFTHRELKDYVEDIRSRLMQVPDVAKIEILGAQDEKIFVEFSVQQLAGLGIDRSAMTAALAAQNIVSPSGILQTGNERLILRVSGAFESEQDILAVNFVANGRLIRLRDIAQVRRDYADPPLPMFRVNGNPAIGIAIAMREGGDILTLGRNIDEAMREIRADLPLGIDPVLVADQPFVVDHAIRDFTTSLWQAIAIIMAVSFVSLGVRAGALIIALGLLVDDAMTTVDVMTSRLAAGDSKEDAATFAYKTLAVPMLTGSFVTAAGFIPIGFARSSAGEYTFSIFAVVSYALILSWIVAVLFAPLLGVVLLSKPKTKQPDKPSAILGYFRGFLVGAMRARWVTIAVTLACFVAAALASPFVARQFFPPSDRPDLLVDLSLPQNASIYASEAAAEKLDDLLKGDPDVDRWSTYVGRGAIRFYLPLNIELPNDFFTQAVVLAKDVAARERLQKKLEAALSENFPSAVSRVSPLGLGPPVGWPVQYRVGGPDISELRDIALQLAQIVATDPGARHVNFDWMEPARMVRIRIDQDQARLLGRSSEAIASVMNSVVTETPVTKVRDGIYLVDVLTRATDENRLSLSTLRTLQIPLPNGRTIPLSQIATFDFAQEYPLIWRRDRVPTLTVQADVVPGVVPESVVDALAPVVAKLSASLPASFRIAVGGTVEESQESLASVFAVVPLKLFVMFSLLMIQLRSFNRLFLVLSIVPMGLIGIVAALLLLHQPLGFVAILGVLSVIEASVSRFRPIMLTAISTVLGLIPIAVTIFWGPMAIAVMGGLLVATVLTLIFLPALYVAWFRIKEPAVIGRTVMPGPTATDVA